MQITIVLERADLTEEALVSFTQFINAVPQTPVKGAVAKRPRPAKKVTVAETPPAGEQGDAAPTPAAAAVSPAAPAATQAAPALAVVPEPAAAAQPVVPAETPPADLDGLRTALREYSQINGREGAIKVLTDVGGAASVSAIDPAKIPAVIAALA